MQEALETLTEPQPEAAAPCGQRVAPGCAGFDDIIAAMDKISDALELESIHWIRGEAGPNWCYGCGKAMAKHLRRRATRKEKSEYILDGGYPAGDEDGCAHCEGCGKLLHYSLTDYGVEIELEYFLERWEPQGNIVSETAYELARVFEYGQHIDVLADDLNRLAGKVRRLI
jgi:hypothetical protein